MTRGTKVSISSSSARLTQTTQRFGGMHSGGGTPSSAASSFLEKIEARARQKSAKPFGVSEEMRPGRSSTDSSGNWSPAARRSPSDQSSSAGAGVSAAGRRQIWHLMHPWQSSEQVGAPSERKQRVIAARRKCSAVQQRSREPQCSQRRQQAVRCKNRVATHRKQSWDCITSAGAWTRVRHHFPSESDSWYYCGPGPSPRRTLGKP